MADVQGNKGSGTLDRGAPVKVGGVYNSTPPTFTDGQRGDAQVDTKGNLKVTVIGKDSTGGSAVTTGADGLATSVAGAVALAESFVFNGTTLDKLRTPTVFKSLSAVVITSETTIWTPTAGKKFRLMGFILAQGVATGAVTLKDNTAGTTIFIIPPNTIGVTLVSPPMGNGILSAAANNVLTATGVSTETLTGVVFGTEE